MTLVELYRKVLLLEPEFPAYFLCGSRGGGKTMASEWILSWYYKRGYLCMSMWASFDMENAFVCLGENGKVGLPVLIIHPRTSVITQNEPLCVCGQKLSYHETDCVEKKPLIQTIPDDTPLADILLQAYREKRIIIFNRGFYGNQREAYVRLAQFLEKYPYLILRKAVPNNINICMMFNELGSIAPSQLKGMKGDYETNTKRQIQTLIREARHVRTVLVADFQRQSDIAKSIASQRDYLIFKRSTKDLLPDEFQWLYDAIERKRRELYTNLDFDAAERHPSLSRLKPWQAYIVFPDRTFELRNTGVPPFRHKKPKDSWTDLANVDIQYIEKEQLKAAENKAKVILEKQAEVDKKEETAREAYRLHKDDGLTYDALAIKYGWIGKNGKPSGQALLMYIMRRIKSGQWSA